MPALNLQSVLCFSTFHAFYVFASTQSLWFASSYIILQKNLTQSPLVFFPLNTEFTY